MPEAPRPIRIPRRALPTFGNGAWRGTIVPSPATPATRDEARATSPFTKVSPTAGFHPVDVTAASAGNRVRLGSLDFLREWWSYIGRMTGLVWIRQAQPSQVSRAMLPARRYNRLPANRRVVYEPESYGNVSAGVRTSGLPQRGVVAQRGRLGGKLRAGRRWDR